LGEIDDGYF
jgi:hypothetical protein